MPMATLPRSWGTVKPFFYGSLGPRVGSKAEVGVYFLCVFLMVSPPPYGLDLFFSFQAKMGCSDDSNAAFHHLVFFARNNFFLGEPTRV